MKELDLTAKESFNESIKREEYLAENEPKPIAQVRYENIVYKNTVAALLAGAELTARNGKTKYSLADVDTRGMDKIQIEREAGILASYIVG